MGSRGRAGLSTACSTPARLSNVIGTPLVGSVWSTSAGAARSGRPHPDVVFAVVFLDPLRTQRRRCAPAAERRRVRPHPSGGAQDEDAYNQPSPTSAPVAGKVWGSRSGWPAPATRLAAVTVPATCRRR